MTMKIAPRSCTQPSLVPVPRTNQTNVKLVRCTSCLQMTMYAIAFTRDYLQNHSNNQKSYIPRGANFINLNATSMLQCSHIKSLSQTNTIVQALKLVQVNLSKKLHFTNCLVYIYQHRD